MMKRTRRLPDGREVEERLDDLELQEEPRLPAGGGGGHGVTLPPADIGGTRPEGYMETWDVLQAPHPQRAAPLPPDEEDDWPTPSP